MPQTTKIFTNAGNGTTRTSKADSDNELGIHEPRLNSSMAGSTFRHKGKMYRYNEKEEIVRFYTPEEERARLKTK